MNVKFLVGLCVFMQISLQAQQVKTFSDLKKGDWFTLEYIQFHTSPDGNQSLRDADIFEYQITVSERTNDDLQFAIQNLRICSQRTRTNHPWGGVSGAGFFDYFDSHYFDDFVLENPYYYGSRDIVTCKLNLRNGLLRDTVYSLEKNNWLYLIFRSI